MIFHITSRKDWEAAQAKGEYVAESLQTEGFIHCSTFQQVLPVAEKFYKGHNDLVLLMIDPARLTATVKWEPPSGGTPPPGVLPGDLFPHVYGPINLEAVVNAFKFVFDSTGSFTLPNI